MTAGETAYYARIQLECRKHNLRCCHMFHGEATEYGAPDFWISGWVPGGFLAREVKTTEGKLTEAQYNWARSLSITVDYKVWVVPRDWDNGLIQAELAAIAVPVRHLRAA